MTDNRIMAEMLRAPTEGWAARRWLKKEPLRSITTWDDIVSKFINEFFPPSRTTNLRNEISNFQQKFDESFHEAWERYKDLLRACPHYGFTKLHQLDTFYNALNPVDQDSLNAAAGGNLLEKSPQDALMIIENKSKQTSDVTTAMTAMLKQLQSNPPPAQIKRMNDVSLKAMQNQIYMVKNELRNEMKTSIQNSLSNQTNEIKNMIASLLQLNTASTSGSRPLPSNTIANPKGELKAITTRSLPDLIPTRMTLELANRAICTPDGIARDVFVPVGEDSDFKDSIDQSDLANLDDLFVDPTPEMFTDEQPLDYSFPPRFDVYPDDFLEIESDAVNFDDYLFDSKGKKIKEFELLIDQLDLPCDIFPHSEYDSFNSKDFSRDDDLPSPDNEDKVFNPGILIHEKSVKIITRVAQENKLASSYAALLFEDFDPPFYELLVFKEVPNSMRLLPFSSENEEKIFKPGIYTSKKVHSCFLLELSHPGYHIFKVNLIFISLMKIFHVQSGKNTPFLDVLLFHFYPP
nr:reverse transcriptase domain-containing protein [Tanacetum cinerariifolium]